MRKIKNFICKECGESFSKQTYFNLKYCSKECQNKAHSKRMTRQGNPLFGKKRNCPWVKESTLKRLKGKTYKEIYGKEKAKEISLKISKHHKGRKAPWARKFRGLSFEKRYGEKRAADIKRKMSKNHKGQVAWNKGKSCPQFAKFGEDNQSWKGGISKQSYMGFRQFLKTKIRERDSNACQWCRKLWVEGEYKFDVHHIDYNKKNPDPNNLITLCKECHGKTKTNRKMWQRAFEASISAMNSVEFPK